ncbi:MAG TPA: metal ABC transporter permease, partial [Aliarcobacter thereius]
MLEILQYDFIQNAIIAGVLISIAAGVIGSLVVVNKITFLTGGIAHSAYGGIGIAIFLGIPVLFGATVFAILTAILIAIITLKNRSRVDAIIGMMWASGMAIGIVFIDLTPGYNVDLMSYLFGSIIAVSLSDLYYMIA